MTGSALTAVHYHARDRQVTWYGVGMTAGEEFDTFISNDVASRLNDEEGQRELEAHLRGLANTGFARESLYAILASNAPEERSWAVGEAMAEAYLNREHAVTWPWNMERDKRTPKASLPGADLVGFQIAEGETRLVLGEVKTSTDANSPPNVMNGRSGMAYQIDNLATNLTLINKLLKWLLPRCKGTAHEPSFNAAVGSFLNSGNKAIALFGVLIRDTNPNEQDLRPRGSTLAKNIQSPTTCHLVALYLPCVIDDLPRLVAGGGA